MTARQLAGAAPRSAAVLSPIIVRMVRELAQDVAPAKIGSACNLNR